MGLNALREPDDARVRRTSVPATIALADGELRLGGFALAKAGGFDKERVAALLAAAYGDTLPHAAVAYLKGALDNQSEGLTALALTYLALAGLPPLADPLEVTWRLSAADGLLKAGAGPETIIEALAPSRGTVECVYNPDQPRVPAGNGQISGQWTSDDGGQVGPTADMEAKPSSSAAGGIQVVDLNSNTAKPTAPDNAADHRSGGRSAASSRSNPGVPVLQPNGQQVRADNGTLLMSPVADLAPVAAAGREVGNAYRALLNDPDAADGATAILYLGTSLANYVGHGGVFDYQREGSYLTGFTPLPQFRDVSNFNVGLFCQQAGLSLDETLNISGLYAWFFSNNSKPRLPYNLETRTKDYTILGYKTGESGTFDLPPSP